LNDKINGNVLGWCLDEILEQNLAGHSGVTVPNGCSGQAIVCYISIPNVQLETLTSPVQSIRMHFHTGIGSELVARQVCVINIVLLGGSFVMGKGYHRGGNGNGN
jgi:hypothetical protein